MHGGGGALRHVLLATVIRALFLALKYWKKSCANALQTLQILEIHFYRMYFLTCQIFQRAFTSKKSKETAYPLPLRHLTTLTTTSCRSLQQHKDTRRCLGKLLQPALLWRQRSWCTHCEFEDPNPPTKSKEKTSELQKTTNRSDARLKRSIRKEAKSRRRGTEFWLNKLVQKWCRCDARYCQNATISQSMESL